MSDTSQGEGWWQASDQKWYPPDTYRLPPPIAPTQSKPWYRRRWVWAAVGVISVGVGLGQNWWDQRQSERAKDELRDLGVSEDFIEQRSDFLRNADDIDVSDGRLSDDEIDSARLSVDAIFNEAGVVEGLSDDAIRTFAIDTCELAAAADSESAFFVSLETYSSEHVAELTFDEAAALGASVGQAFCPDLVNQFQSEDPMTIGSHPQLDQLHDGCLAGSLADCDMLYISSPFRSEYEEVAQTCGGRNEAFDEICTFHYNDFSEMSAVEDQCQLGFFPACGLLYAISPVGSPEEVVATTCGGRREPSEDLGCITEFGIGSR